MQDRATCRLLVEFASVVDAVRCAVEVQKRMAERNVGIAAEDRIEFRGSVRKAGGGVRITAQLTRLPLGYKLDDERQGAAGMNSA